VAYYDTTSGTATWQTWTSPVFYYRDCSSAWPEWTAGATSATTGNGTWQVWASDTTTVTVSVDTTWGTWASDDEFVEISRIGGQLPRSQTHAELEAERKRRKEAEKKAEEAVAAQEQAEKKAKDLLEDLIGEDQLKVYEQTGRLLVHGRKYDYLLTKSGDVRRFEKDKVVDLCIHLVDKFKMPETDNVISLKLLAEANEEGFNKLANTIRSGSAEELPEAACA